MVILEKKKELLMQRLILGNAYLLIEELIMDQAIQENLREFFLKELKY